MVDDRADAVFIDVARTIVADPDRIRRANDKLDLAHDRAGTGQRAIRTALFGGAVDDHPHGGAGITRGNADRQIFEHVGIALPRDQQAGHRLVLRHAVNRTRRRGPAELRLERMLCKPSALGVRQARGNTRPFRKDQTLLRADRLVLGHGPARRSVQPIRTTLSLRGATGYASSPPGHPVGKRRSRQSSTIAIRLDRHKPKATPAETTHRRGHGRTNKKADRKADGWKTRPRNNARETTPG